MNDFIIKILILAVSIYLVGKITRLFVVQILLQQLFQLYCWL